MLGLVPLGFWNFHLYHLGGDDSLLYYLIPGDMMDRWTFNIVGNNALSGLGAYGTQMFTFPFFVLLATLRTLIPRVNTQLFSYGMVLGGGFLAFYLLAGNWLRPSLKSDAARGIGGLAYVLSTFSVYTVWNSQLFALYLIPVFPLALHLFIRAVRTNHMTYIAAVALLLSMFSITLLSVAWLTGLLIASIPLLLVLFLNHKWSFVRMTFALGLLLTCLNAYWLVHFIQSALEGGSTSSFISSKFASGQDQLIQVVSVGAQVLYPLFNLFHRNIQEQFDWTSNPIYLGWQLPLLPGQVIQLAAVVWGLTGTIARDIDKRWVVAFLTSWLLCLYLFTVRIGSWGLGLFLWLTHHLPAFAMFRNMYDKFGIALAFSFALLLTIAVSRLLHRIKSSGLQFAVGGVIAFTVILGGIPFLLGAYFKSPMWTTKETYNTISGFNQDFTNLSHVLAKKPSTWRVTWLPMNSANYVQVADQSLRNHYYSGVSPLQPLVDKTDFAGTLSFGEDSARMLNAIVNRDFDSTGQLLQKYGIRLIVVNRDISPDLAQSYLFSLHRSGDVWDAQQDPRMQSILLGNKISDFGRRYSLYEISSRFRSELIHLSPGNPSSRISYKRVTNSEYSISVRGLKESSELIFLEPFHQKWTLTTSSGIELEVPHGKANGYANGWHLAPGRLRTYSATRDSDGAISLDLILRFTPQDYVVPFQVVSVFSLVLLLSYLAIANSLHRCRRGVKRTLPMASKGKECSKTGCVRARGRI